MAKTIKRFKETGSHEDRPTKGRPRVTSASEDKFIRFTSLRNRRLTAAKIRDQVNATQSSSSRHISTTTVKRRLCAADLHGKIASRKPLLRTGNKQKRLVWAKEHKEWTLDQWEICALDNDPKHTSRLCKGYLTKKESDGVLRQMTWPPHSPDLNPIEMVWGELDRRVKAKGPTSAKHLWELLQDCWKIIPGDYLLKLIKRMPRVCKAKASVFLHNRRYKQLSEWARSLLALWLHGRPTILLYLNLVLGNVNVTLLSNQAKFAYKDEYEKFKLYLTIILLLGAIACRFVLHYRVTDEVFNFLLVWYFCTLTIRESILISNGSRIKGWWVSHHYVSTFLSGVMLTWPDGLMYQMFRNQFLAFSIYQSCVQFLQYYYQSGCLYRLRALGERNHLDLTVGARGNHDSEYESEASLDPDSPEFQSTVDSLIEAVNHALKVDDDPNSAPDNAVSFKREENAQLHRTIWSGRLFGEKLDKLISDATGGKSKFLPQHRPRTTFQRQQHFRFRPFRSSPFWSTSTTSSRFERSPRTERDPLTQAESVLAR
ncbi:unnamed protein product [Ranitomeya imitator]|uniref:Transposase n=1 Tax=Ranitomeya imitator TaxID=111125 RepID=A0ABN9M8M6_9NEOB|nr:unnamed protein product [Ranitomeya imitator]